jgi:hypothetical protein
LDCSTTDPYWETQWYFHDPVWENPPFLVSVHAGETTTRIDAWAVRVLPAIVGTITEDGSGAPIAKYCARVWQGDRYVAGYWFSDANGHFAIRRDDGDAMPPGLYQVHFEDCTGGGAAWLAEWYDDSYFKETSTSIQIGDRGTTTVNASLARGAEISGTVTLHNGARPTGLPGLCVGAVPTWGGEAGKPVGLTDQFTDGHYAIQGLPGGEYKVRFARCHDSPKIPNWATQWWLGAPSFALGQTVTLPKQGTVTGVDAVMTLAPEPVVAGIARKCIVPRLAGMTVRQARRKLHGAGCALGRITRVHARGRHGRVLSSRARAGKRLPRWTKVAIRVAR